MGRSIAITFNVEGPNEPKPVNIFKGNGVSFVFTFQTAAKAAFSLASVGSGGMSFAAKEKPTDAATVFSKTGTPDSPSTGGKWTIALVAADLPSSGVLLAEVAFTETGGKTVCGQFQINVLETIL